MFRPSGALSFLGPPDPMARAMGRDATNQREPQRGVTTMSVEHGIVAPPPGLAV